MIEIDFFEKKLKQKGYNVTFIEQRKTISNNFTRENSPKMQNMTWLLRPNAEKNGRSRHPYSQNSFRRVGESIMRPEEVET